MHQSPQALCGQDASRDRDAQLLLAAHESILGVDTCRPNDLHDLRREVTFGEVELDGRAPEATSARGLIRAGTEASHRLSKSLHRVRLAEELLFELRQFCRGPGPIPS